MASLGYWDTRGTAQPIRYLLAYLGVDYTNKTYSGFGEEWFAQDKLNLNSNYPNLPYFIDQDGTTVTESSAIALYLIKKYKRNDLLGLNVDGSFSEKEIRVSQTIGVITDLRAQLFGAIFFYDFKTNQENLKQRIFSLYNRLLASLDGKEFLLESLTYADFLFYEMIHYMRHIFPQETKVPIGYLERFEEIPQIKTYLSSEQSIKKLFPEYVESTILS